MNLKMLRYITGQLLLVEGALMLIPLITMLIYGEFGMLYSVLIPIGMLLVLGVLLSLRKPEGSALGAKDGFVVVGLSWIILSFFGCLPFVLSGLIPNFIDAYGVAFTQQFCQMLGSRYQYPYGIPLGNPFVVSA